jgi:SAM-dependent methyltransferase
MGRAMRAFRLLRVYNVSELFAGERDLLDEAISRYEDLSFAELVQVLDESQTNKRSLPWEFRRAYRLRRLRETERKQYYADYASTLLCDGAKQLNTLLSVLDNKDLSSEAPASPGKSVLEIGAGRGGFLANALASPQFASMTFQGLDVDVGSLLINMKLNEEAFGVAADRTALSERLSLTASTENVLPFDNGAFDLIVSFSTLEHVGRFDQQLALLNEVCRCLKAGGLAVMTFPNRFSLLKPEEHVGVWFLGFCPQRFKNTVSRIFSGMPSDDIFPLSICDLQRARRELGKQHEIDFKVASSARLIRKFRRNRWFAFWFEVIGPGYVIRIEKK